MIIDAHAHLNTPPELLAMRAQLLADGGFHPVKAKVPEASLAKFADDNVALMDQVGTDVQLISPRPFQLGTSMQPSRLVAPWVAAHNDGIAQTVQRHPTRFAGVAGLPIVPGAPVTAAFDELSRTVEELGFVGVLLNPDPAEGLPGSPALGDEYWFPLWERMIELDVPALVHSAGCYSERETYSEHFITEESIAILSVIRGGVFERFPELKLIISHGGGSVPYQLGRWQAERLHPALGGTAESERFETALKRFYFDSVLHYPLALELLLRTVGSDRVLFGTERPGSGSAPNPEAGGRHFDDLKPVIEEFGFLDASDRDAIFEGNARRVFPRLSVGASGAA